LNYEETVAAIQSLEPRGWRLGLDRMQEFALRAGLKDSLGPASPSFLHVAGTNGKGSVTAFLQSMLVESGFLTGAYYSPFVYDVRERWQIGRQMVSKELLAELASELWPVGDSLAATAFGGITEFEFKTGLAFLLFQRKKCDWVALEVGLGGRLDATNIIEPAAAAVVSIGLDHVSVLGATHSKIAREKAGVIKQGRPVIIGRLPTEAAAVVHAVAFEQGAPVWEVGKEIALEPQGDAWRVSTPARTYDRVVTGLVGTWQPHNAAVALGLMDASGATRSTETNREGLAKAWLPGRMQRCHALGRDWILDGAHNAEAGASLRDSLAQSGIQQVFLLTGMVAGHDQLAFYQTLADVVNGVVVTPIQFHRAMPPDVLAGMLTDGLGDVTVTDTLEKAISEALTAPAHLPILVTGSFYLVGEVGRYLGIGETPS